MRRHHDQDMNAAPKIVAFKEACDCFQERRSGYTSCQLITRRDDAHTTTTALAAEPIILGILIGVFTTLLIEGIVYLIHRRRKEKKELQEARMKRLATKPSKPEDFRHIEHIGVPNAPTPSNSTPKLMRVAHRRPDGSWMFTEAGAPPPMTPILTPRSSTTASSTHHPPRIHTAYPPSRPPPSPSTTYETSLHSPTSTTTSRYPLMQSAGYCASSVGNSGTSSAPSRRSSMEADRSVITDHSYIPHVPVSHAASSSKIHLLQANQSSVSVSIDLYEDDVGSVRTGPPPYNSYIPTWQEQQNFPSVPALPRRGNAGKH